MHRTRAVLLVIVLALLGLIALLLIPRPQSDASQAGILMYCAAGMQLPVAEIAQQFKDEYGAEINLQFGGSGTLLSNLSIAKGELYLAADTGYIQHAQERGLIEDELPVAYLTPGLAVAAGNPRGIDALEDLVGIDDLRIGLANPDAASIGKISRRVLTERGLWEAVEARTFVFKPTVNEVANDLKLGTIDVGILWDATANQYTEIDFVALPAFASHRQQVTIGVLRSAADTAAAFRFARYISAADRGLNAFAEHGYDIIDGDRWAWEPDLLLFSGAMLRPAIQEKLSAFEKREGVRITPVYNGCGILVSQMKAGERPDAYFSCDVSFMDDVQNLFGESTVVSGNDMVILVARGNPKDVTAPQDLARPGLRLGFAHPDKSALGKLTQRLLQSMNLYQSILDSGNLKLDSPTGDFLVNQLRVDSLDAVIVYRSNALAAEGTREDTEIVEMDHPLAVAHQPYAVGKGSDYPHTMTRLFRDLTGDDSKAIFLQTGFQWELPTEE